MCGVSKKPSVEKLWREKANMQMTHRQPLLRSFGTNETQQLREGQLVGRMMLQRLATGATGVKQAIQAKAYSGQRGTHTRMRSIYTCILCTCIAP